MTSGTLAPRRPPVVVLAVLWPMLVGERVGAAVLAGAARSCERAVEKAGARAFDDVLSALSRCQHRVARDGGRSCLDTPAPQAARTVVARRLARRLGARCDDAAVTALGFGGECAGSRTVAELIRCVRGSYEAEALRLMAVAAATTTALPADARRCQAAAVDAVAQVTARRLRAIAACKRRPPRDLPPGTDCAHAPVVAGRIARLRAGATARITARCGATARATARFGPPCDTPPDGAGLAACLLAAADAAGDALAVAAHRDRSFCGDAADRVEARIDGLLARMTPAEKAEQMHGVRFERGWRTPANAAQGLPGLGMLDGPRGASFLLGTATTFPVAIARAATFDVALEERIGEAIGTEVRAKGADVLLAPVLNIVRHPRGGRTQESYGEDTVLLGEMGTAFVRGAQRRVIASPKHFAANSIENTRQVLDVRIDERTLREVYLPHFRRVVERGRAASLMTAYNQVNGAFCAENVHLLHDLLEGEWRFRGFVESDWLVGTHSTVPSLAAGLDIEMPFPRFYGQPVVDAVAATPALAATVDDAVRGILRVQLCFRLDTNPAMLDPAAVETSAHRALAREAARESLVLLTNDGGTLPFDRSRLRSLVVVGELAAVPNVGDAGSSRVSSSNVVTVLDGIAAAAGAVPVTHVPRPALSPADAAAVAAADAAIVVVGLTSADEGEGQITHGDRDSLVLPRSQDALVTAVAALNARTVVVLVGGGPVLMPWVDAVPAILVAWYPGQEGGHALADVLFGEVAPSGKLPLSFPVAEADLPPFDPLSPVVTYDYFHGYRHLDREGRAPLFPFGHGLSYTTFAYANVTVTPAAVPAGGHVRVTAEVTNAGQVAGAEVVQLYVGAQGSRVERARKELKAFTRIHLAPGETRSVAFDLPTADLAFWDVTAGRWEIEAVDYDVRVGGSSAALTPPATFQVTPD